MSNRRQFIKDSCTFCIYAVGAVSFSSLLSRCASLPVYKATTVNNIVSIPVASILPNEKIKIIRTDKLEYDILLVTNEDKSYHALLMQCTHQDNPLVATSGGLSCNMHGSTFNLNGEVTKGPAARALKQFGVTEENNNINIHLS